jgi:tetratricopeptide (TPR) repeat protein
VRALEEALANSTSTKIRFLAARAFIEAGEFDKAEPLARELAAELPPEPEAYGRILLGNIALARGDWRQAIKEITEANDTFDTWIGHYDLGRAYLAAEGAHLQADAEFERTLKRSGEALSLFLDEEPTFAYLPMAHYYQGRAREAQGVPAFADSYRTYLQLRGNSREDPLVADLRQRVEP